VSSKKELFAMGHPLYNQKLLETRGNLEVKIGLLLATKSQKMTGYSFTGRPLLRNLLNREERQAMLLRWLVQSVGTTVLRKKHTTNCALYSTIQTGSETEPMR
jgi:hypothetical protein